MLYHLAKALSPHINALNVIHYISFRFAGALLTVLFLSLVLGDRFIETSKLFFRSKAREFAPETHKAKDNMPTMGGLFIIFVVTISTLLWCNLGHAEVWLFLGCLISFGVLGFWDDWTKITHKKGISERYKFRIQVALAATLVLGWFFWLNPSTKLCLPFFKNLNPDLGYFFIPWAMFIIIGTSNAVNLTDGLDGLAIGSLLPNFSTFAVIAYLAGHIDFAQYLHIPFTGTSEVAIIAVILAGASLGFLWYNAYPAQIFMGDVGSLSLGAALGFIALLTKQELLLGIAGGLFVVETVSVMLQVFSYKYFKKRIFRMAPIHHHFELLGWPEAKITIRFAIISCILCLFALVTLKLR